MQKLITFAVPCYNSAAYMRHCIETLLSAGEQSEIILVDDGSVKDETPAICDEYAAKYPTIVKAIQSVYTVPGYNLLFVETVVLGEEESDNGVSYLYVTSTDGKNIVPLEIPGA